MSVSHSIEEYAEALRQSRGLLSDAATRLGISRQAVQGRVARSPTLQEIRAEARESIVDMAESRLFDCVDRSEAWAIALVLKTQGRERGYVEKTEQTHAVSGDIRITIEAVDDRSDPAPR